MLFSALLGALALFSADNATEPGEDSVAYSSFWKERGLHIAVGDSLVMLDSVGGFRLTPPLVFKKAGLEDPKGEPLRPILLDVVRKVAKNGVLKEELLNWGQGSLAFLASFSHIALDPRAGTLRLGAVKTVFGMLESDRLPKISSRPRRPQTLEWTKNGWKAPVTIHAGAGELNIPVRVGKDLALLRVGEAQLNKQGWELGDGAHLVEWQEGAVKGNVDTLQGRLRLELAAGANDLTDSDDSLEESESRIVGWGGASGGRWDRAREERFQESLQRLRLSEQAATVRLLGKTRWRRGFGRADGRFENGQLRLDTAMIYGGPDYGSSSFGGRQRWGCARVLDPVVDATGAPRSGTLLDTLLMEAGAGRGQICFSPGTRLVRGLPALGGPGSRELSLSLYGDGEVALEDSSLPKQLRLRLEGERVESRKARSSRRLRLRWGNVVVEGFLGAERDNSAEDAVFRDEGRPELAVDKFQPHLDSGIAFFPGLQDTLGQAAEVVSESFSQELLARETYWDLRSSLPVRQWREPNRPWLSWRFRPHLSFRGTSFVLVPDSLQVSWNGGPYVKATARGQYYPTSKGMACGGSDCPAIAVPLAAGTLRGEPWPGLGRFLSSDTLFFKDDTSLLLAGKIVPSESWSGVLGKAAIRARLQVRPERDSLGHWRLTSGPRPALTLLPDFGQILSKFHAKTFLARDTFVLSSSEGRLRLERRWPDPVLEGSFLIGRPAVPDTGMAILRGLLWEGDSLGNLVSAREEWEPLARPLELPVAGGARVRAKEPLAVTVFTDGTRVQGLRARAQGVTLFRGGDAWGFAADSLAEFDGHGKPLGEIRRLGKSRRPEALPPREGRVAVRLGTHFLKVDRVEVSRARWQACVSAGACPQLKSDSCRTWIGTSRPEDSLRAGRFDAWHQIASMPAGCVDLEVAERFCHWSHGRLPTHREFHLLAGVVVDSLRAHRTESWPINTWWNQMDRWRPDGQDPFPDLMPSGSLRPVPPGIYDLAGNAEEWCTDSDVGDDEIGGIYFRCRKSGASDGQVRNSFNAKQGFRCVEE